jgi:hypothetical protein
MTSANLEKLASAKQLKAEPPSRKELEGLGPEHWRVLALCHERRNAADYEGELKVDDKLVTDLLKATEAVLAKVSALELPK